MAGMKMSFRAGGIIEYRFMFPTANPWRYESPAGRCAGPCYHHPCERIGCRLAKVSKHRREPRITIHKAASALVNAAGAREGKRTLRRIRPAFTIAPLAPAPTRLSPQGP